MRVSVRSLGGFAIVLELPSSACPCDIGETLSTRHDFQLESLRFVHRGRPLPPQDHTKPLAELGVEDGDELIVVGWRNEVAEEDVPAQPEEEVGGAWPAPSPEEEERLEAVLHEVTAGHTPLERCLQDCPGFDALRRRVLERTVSLPNLLATLRQHSPNALDLIQRNQRAFLDILRNGLPVCDTQDSPLQPDEADEVEVADEEEALGAVLGELFCGPTALEEEVSALSQFGGLQQRMREARTLSERRLIVAEVTSLCPEAAGREAEVIEILMHGMPHFNSDDEGVADEEEQEGGGTGCGVDDEEEEVEEYLAEHDHSAIRLVAEACNIPLDHARQAYLNAGRDAQAAIDNLLHG